MNLFPEGLPSYQIALGLFALTGLAGAAIAVVVRWYRRPNPEALDAAEQMEALREEYEHPERLEQWQIDDATNGRR